MPDIKDILDALNQTFVPFLDKAWTVTTEFGAPIAAGPDKGEPHYGIDYGTPKGTPLYAPGSGKVINPTAVPGGGSTTGRDDAHTISILFENGVIMQFAHLDQVFVRPGDAVAPGDFIGKTGDYGIGTGAHLHVAAWLKGEPIDPRALFDPTTDFTDYESRPGATGGSVPILGPFTEGALGGLDSLGQIAAAVVAFVGTILNPQTWARIFAIIGGALMTIVGAYWLWQST